MNDETRASKILKSIKAKKQILITSEDLDEFIVELYENRAYNGRLIDINDVYCSEQIKYETFYLNVILDEIFLIEHKKYNRHISYDRHYGKTLQIKKMIIPYVGLTQTGVNDYHRIMRRIRREKLLSYVQKVKTTLFGWLNYTKN